METNAISTDKRSVSAKNIMITIAGRQFDENGPVDRMELMTEGRLYKRNDTLYLVYEESELSGMPGCSTRIKLKDGKLSMTRRGKDVPIHTEIEFEKGRRYEGYYDTPYGAIEMEVLTNDIKSDLDAEAAVGSLSVDYHLALKGLFEGRNLLDINLRPIN